MIEGEFDFLRWIRRRAGGARGCVLVGPGDDAAVVRLGGADVVIHVDNTVEGIHYARGTPWRAVGAKSVMRCASDIAAMGCRPVAALAGAVLPRHLEQRDRRAIVAGMLAACRAAGISLVGGDLTAGTGKGPTVLSVTVVGETPPGRKPVLRSGAKPGDLVVVTGRLGGSILGRHLRVRPRIREVLALQKALTLHAMIDVSDGLAADLGHILDESGVGVRIEAASVPIHPDAVKLACRTGRKPLTHALEDGEDYELIFTFPIGQARRLPALVRRLRCPLSVIGRIQTRGRVLVGGNGERTPFFAKGFAHRWR